jgi:hypothetical protein
LIKKIITYVTACICILFVYRSFLYFGIRKNKQGIFSKYNDVFLKEGNTYDVLFLGSSRAEMHFEPQIFDSITKLNSYNLGISGASVKVNFIVLKTYCHQHQKPKHIILNLDYFSLKSDSDTLNDFPRYFPYLNNDYLRAGLNTVDDRFTSFYYNPFHSLPYTQIDFLSASLHGWLNISGKYDTLMYKGFQTIPSNEEGQISKVKPIYSFISKKNRNYIDSIISFSKKNQINLTLLTTPIYGRGYNHVLNKSVLVNQLNHIACINHIPYFDYTDSLIFDDPKLYFDEEHLNLKGAKKFSNHFSVSFNKILNVKTLLIQ